ncbi:MAG: DUF427 domain-containing protein [Acidimicrobiales bacterium]
MTLTKGSGPFGRNPAGQFNFTRTGPAHVLFLDPSPKRVRAFLGDEAVVDSRGAKLLHETGLTPVWYLPVDDVRMDLMVATDHRSHCPFKGDASYWSVRLDGRTVDNVAWGYPEPLPPAPPIGGHVAFYHERMDAWFEEEERVIGHPLNPYHRIDVREGSRHVRVRVGGEVVADTEQPKLLFETGLPVRYYVADDDVGADLLEPTATTTICPYKGVASYESVTVDGRTYADVAWAYREPLSDATRVAGHRSFMGDGVEVEVDGVAESP